MAMHRLSKDGKCERNKKNSPRKEMSSQEASSSNSSESDQKLKDQVLHVREALHIVDAEHHPNKRTFGRTRSEGEVSIASGPSSEKSSDANTQKKGRKLTSSCSPSAASSPQIVKILDPSSPKEKVARPVIPIGPGFQAELPDWIALTKKGKFYGSPGDSKTLRWLGTDVWPTYSLKKKTVNRETGKGRHDACCCSSPGSTNCIKRHTKEARQVLATELGPAFYTWKFDQMGEDVSKSWTAKEEQRFESLVKKNPLSSSEGFWELASKAFPSKSKKTLVSYYYNVFLVLRMRSLTMSSADQVESDDDHNGEFFAG